MPLYDRDPSCAPPPVMMLQTGYEVCGNFLGALADTNALLKDALFSVSNRDIAIDEEPSTESFIGSPVMIGSSRLLYLLASDVVFAHALANGIVFDNYSSTTASSASRRPALVGTSVFAFSQMYTATDTVNHVGAPSAGCRQSLTHCMCLPDIDLGNDTVRVYRIADAASVSPYVVADRSKIFGAGVPVSMSWKRSGSRGCR